MGLEKSFLCDVPFPWRCFAQWRDSALEPLSFRRPSGDRRSAIPDLHAEHGAVRVACANMPRCSFSMPSSLRIFSPAGFACLVSRGAGAGIRPARCSRRSFSCLAAPRPQGSSTPASLFPIPFFRRPCGVSISRLSAAPIVLPWLSASRPRLMALGRDQVAFLLCTVLAGYVVFCRGPIGTRARSICAPGRACWRSSAALILAILIVPVLLTMQFLGRFEPARLSFRGRGGRIARTGQSDHAVCAEFLRLP